MSLADDLRDLLRRHDNNYEFPGDDCDIVSRALALVELVERMPTDTFADIGGAVPEIIKVEPSHQELAEWAAKVREAVK